MNRHKKLFAVLTLVCFLFTLMPVAAFAETEIEKDAFSAELQVSEDVLYSGTCGTNLTWRITTQGALVIEGVGSIPRYFQNEVPWHDYTNVIKSIEVKDGVTSIGENSFYGCSNAVSVDIADSVTYIGNWAFDNCGSLKTITFPDNITYIGNVQFGDCTSLEVVNLPMNLQDIGDNLFAGCSNLKTINISNNETFYSVDGVLFQKQGDKIILVRYPSGKTEKSYKIPDGVTDIAVCAFDSCNNLQEVLFSDTVTTIEKYGFYECNSLSNVVLSNNLEKIAYVAFHGNVALERIEFPASLITIENDAFGCHRRDIIESGKN